MLFRKFFWIWNNNFNFGRGFDIQTLLPFVDPPLVKNEEWSKFCFLTIPEKSCLLWKKFTFRGVRQCWYYYKNLNPSLIPTRKNYSLLRLVKRTCKNFKSIRPTVLEKFSSTTLRADYTKFNIFCQNAHNSNFLNYYFILYI